MFEQKDPDATVNFLPMLIQGKRQGLKEIKLLRAPFSGLCPSPCMFAPKHKDIISLSSCLVIVTCVIIIVCRTCLPLPISHLPLCLHLSHFPTWKALSCKNIYVDRGRIPPSCFSAKCTYILALRLGHIWQTLIFFNPRWTKILINSTSLLFLNFKKRVMIFKPQVYYKN